MATDKKPTRHYTYVKAHYVKMVAEKCKTEKNVNDNPVMILAVDPLHHATIRTLVCSLGGTCMDVEQKIAAHKGRLAV